MATHPEIVEGYHNQIRHDVIEHVPPTDGTLLDLGGGIGATAAHLKSIGRSRRAGCLDAVSPEHAADGLDFHVSGDFEDPAFLRAALAENGPFGTILCLDILEHLVDPWAVVAALHEALEPGGRIVASIPNVRHYRVSGGLFLRNRWHLTDAGILDRTHLRFFVKETAVELMTHSGLELELVTAPERAGNRRARALLSRLSKGRIDTFFDVQYVVRVRRPLSDQR